MAAGAKDLPFGGREGLIGEVNPMRATSCQVRAVHLVNELCSSTFLAW